MEDEGSIPTQLFRRPNERLPYPASLTLRRYRKQPEVADFSAAFDVYASTCLQFRPDGHQECTFMEFAADFGRGNAGTVVESFRPVHRRD